MNLNLMRLGLLMLAMLLSTNGASFGQNAPFGTLGLPLGTFAVVEGECHAVIKNNGVPQNFRAEVVNGKKMAAPVEMEVEDWTEKMKVGKHYVMHGYENGEWDGAPPLPADESESIDKDWRKEARLPFAFRTHFRITSIEREDGVSVPRAAPVNPGFVLVEPKPGRPPTKPPEGSLGVTLGTYVMITIGAPRRPTKAIVCEVLAVNGKAVKRPTTITVPFLEAPSGHETEVVHGFESGEWRGATALPESEIKAMSVPGLVDIPSKVEFCRYFIVTNWTTRTL